MTVTLTNQSKNSATLTDQKKQGGTAILPGNPIGLLLALTYPVFVGAILSGQARHSATFTNQAKS